MTVEALLGATSGEIAATSPLGRWMRTIAIQITAGNNPINAMGELGMAAVQVPVSSPLGRWMTVVSQFNDEAHDRGHLRGLLGQVRVQKGLGAFHTWAELVSETAGT